MWQGEKHLILLASKVLNVSPFGVNILGSVPYINKLGLVQKTEQYGKGTQFKYNWLQVAKDDTEKAICQCKLVDAKGKDLCDFVIGECSPSTIKMGTLKGYQNHMAQTRSRNRAILEVYGAKIHNEMMSRIEQMSKTKEVNPQEASAIGSVTSTSVEEMTTVPKEEKNIMTTVNQDDKPGVDHISKLREKLKEMGAKTEKEAFVIVKKKTGVIMKDFKITQKHAQIILFQVLNTQ